jgi:DNA polymerase-3 subunit delta'
MGMVTEDLVDKRILDRFRSLSQRQRLAHAYLLVGPQGSGKLATAGAIAKMLNCEDPGNKPCGQCPSCMKIDAQNHPDVLLCDRGEDETIKILKVREIIHKMQLRPYEAMMKIVIIHGVDLLTTEAANAFLKTLEEPAPDTLLLLTTAAVERVLDTVKSRCQLVHFPGLSCSFVSGQLVNRGVMDPAGAQLAAGFSEGCYGKARQLQDKGFINWKNEVMDQFLFGPAEEKFLKSVISDNQSARDALDALLFCFKDMLLLKAHGGQERMTNKDRLDDLKKCAERYSVDHLRDILNTIVNAKRMLDGNLNIKVPFMVLKEKIWLSNSYKYS